MRVLGIDTGIKGGLAVATESKLFAMEVMPKHNFQLVDIIQDWGITHVYLERAQAMPKNGVVAMFNYGTGFGLIQGIVIALKLPLRLVPPKEWTRDLHRGTKGGDPKSRSLESALRLFPDMNFIATPRSKKPHEGLIDAALICEFGRRELLGLNAKNDRTTESALDQDV